MIFRIIIAALLVAGCTQNETVRAPHEKALETATSSLEAQDRELCREDMNKYQLDASVCDADFTSISTLQLAHVQSVLLSSQLLQDARVTGSTYYLNLLWNLQFSIDKSQDQALVRASVEVMLRGCGTGETLQCEYTSVFRRLSTTYPLLVGYLANTENTHDLSTVVILAYAAKNATTDHRLLKAVALRSEVISRDARVQSIVAVDLNQHREQLTNLEREQIGFYLRSSENKLSDAMSSTELSNLVEQKSRVLGENALATKIQLLRQQRVDLLRSLNLENVSVDSNLLKILDLFHNSVVTDSNESTALRRFYSEREIVDAYKLFTKLQIALQIHEADLLVKQVADRLRFQTTTLLAQFIEDSDSIRRRWSLFKTRGTDLMQWVQFGMRDSANKDEIRVFTDGLDVTIKTYSEIPHTFYLALILARLGFDSRATFDSSTFVFNASTVFSELIAPKNLMFSWLDYTGNPNVLDSYMVKNALGFLLKSHFLGAIGENQEEFIQYFVLNINNRFSDKIDRQIHDVETFLNTSQRARSYFDFCEKLEKGEPQNLRISLEDLRFSMFYNAFDSRTFIMSGFVTGDDFGGNTSNPGGMPFGKVDFADFFEHAHLDTRTIYNIYAVMQESLRTRASTSPALENAITSIQGKKSRLTPVFQRWNDIGFCLGKIVEEEKKAQEFVINEEKKYLQRIYRDLKQMSNQPQLLTQIRERYSDTLLLQELKARNIPSLDRIETTSYLYTRFDFFARVGHYLKSYSPKFIFEIDLPSDIERSQFYRLSTNRPTSFLNLFVTSETTEEQFLQSATRVQMSSGGFTSWRNRQGEIANVYTSRIENLAAQLRLKTVSVEVYLDEYRKFCDYFKMTDHERYFLAAGRESILLQPATLDESFIAYHMTEYVVMRTYGLYDLPLRFVAEDVLGMDYYVKRNRLRPDSTISTGTEQGFDLMQRDRKGPRAQGEYFMASMNNLDKRLLLFPIDPRMIEREYHQIIDQVKDQEALFEEFREAVLARDHSGMQIDVTLNMAITGPVFSSPLLRSYRTEMSTFHSRTQNCFKADANCY